MGYTVFQCSGNEDWLLVLLSHIKGQVGKAFTHMNKADLAEKVHGVLGGTKADAERAVECVVDGIVSGLKSGDEVSIAGLGIFSTKMRPARQGRNPRTGETIQIVAMRVPKFRPAKALKDAVK